jgi:hypothetical protein
MLDAMRADRRPAVVGIADHSGWANLVTVSVTSEADGGPGGRVVVVDRRRCPVVDDDLPRQPYHAAAGLAADDAEQLVAQVAGAAGVGADRQLGALVDELGGEHRLVALAVRSGIDRQLPDTVAEVTANHTAMHVAEGELYRDAWADAAAGRDIGVALYPRKDAIGEAAVVLGTTASRLGEVLAALGRELGPPWQKEHREAAAAALGELSHHTAVRLHG